ncbi:MAG: hypothetical protein F6K30_23805 [Cyanothece sp. SIO2G6]|nr:hypothetical protein [Cyanothece sp. SIO2G6]
MTYYDVYGFKSDGMKAAKIIVESCLHIRLKARDSFFIGDYYKFVNEEGEEFSIKENRERYDEDEENYREPDFQEFPVLLYIDGASEKNIGAYRKALTARKEVTLLHTEAL